MNHYSKKVDLSHLPDSQSGTVRHKNAKMSYDTGYDYGRRIDT
ncbi:hypothetical protein [Vagococcus fluvialis]